MLASQLVLSLSWQPHCRDFMYHPVVYRRYSLHSRPPGPLGLTIFPPPLQHSQSLIFLILREFHTHLQCLDHIHKCPPMPSILLISTDKKIYKHRVPRLPGGCLSSLDFTLLSEAGMLQVSSQHILSPLPAALCLNSFWCTLRFISRFSSSSYPCDF